MPGTSHRAGITAKIDDDGSRPVGEDRGAGVFGVAVDVNENIDAIASDLLRRLTIRQFAEIGPVVETSTQPLLRLVAMARLTNIIGKGLDGCRVAPFQDFAQGETHGVAAKVRRDVTHAQPLSGSRHPPHRVATEIAHVGASDEGLAIAVRLRQLEHGIIGVAGQGYRRHALDELSLGHMLGLPQRRPGAKALPCCDPVLRGLGFIGTQFDGLPEVGFSLREPLRAFAYAAHVLQRHQLVGNPIGVDVLVGVCIVPPLPDCGVDLPAIFEGSTEVDMARPEVGRGPDTGLKGLN